MTSLSEETQRKRRNSTQKDNDFVWKNHHIHPTGSKAFIAKNPKDRSTFILEH